MTPATSTSLKSGRVEAVVREKATRSAEVQCLLGRDLRFDSQLVCLQCYQELQPLVEDLARVAGVVAYADRLVARCTSDVWARELDLVIPVSDPDRWNSATVQSALIRALDLVTGDCWNVRFTKLPLLGMSGFQTQFLKDEAKPPVVIPFSDGLDSYATLKLEAAADPTAEFAPVTVSGHWHRCVTGFERLFFPFSITDQKRPDGHRFREPSYRSRAFAYTVMAGAVAHLRNAVRVVIPESGQGILGPWLQPVANEAPDIRTHPKFTRVISEFLGEILGRRIEFIHPRLFHTKAETLIAANLTEDTTWKRTRSCPRDQRHVRLDGHCYQCGICSACLLRRMSVHGARLVEDSPYHWMKLQAAEFENAAMPGAPPPSRNDERIARAGVLSHFQLAEFLETRRADRRVKEASEDLSDLVGLSAHEVEAKVRSLLQQHRDEWTSFLGQCGSDSFILKWRNQLP